MRRYDVRVVGALKRKKRQGRLRRLIARTGHTLKVILLRPRLLMLAGLAAFVVFVGTPHAGWDYECRHPIRPGQPCRSVSYCAYYGIQGRRVEFPEYGQSCQLFTLLPPDWNRIIKGVLP